MYDVPLSSCPLKDVLQALLSGLRRRRLPSDPAVQAAHPPLRHSSQSQRGTAVGFLGVGRPARAHVLHRTRARIGDGRDGSRVRHQGRGGQGDHLHPSASGQTGTSSPQGAGHHHLAAGPHHLPEHLHHLHLNLDIPVLSLCAALQMTLSGLLTHKAIPQKTLCLGHIRAMQRQSNIQDKVDAVSKRIS